MRFLVKHIPDNAEFKILYEFGTDAKRLKLILEALDNENKFTNFGGEINTSFCPNFHILSAVYISASGYRSDSVKITSQRFKHSVTVGLSGDYPDISGDAIAYLQNAGFNIIGKGEGLKGFYFISDTFKPLKDERNKAAKV